MEGSLGGASDRKRSCPCWRRRAWRSHTKLPLGDLRIGSVSLLAAKPQNGNPDYADIAPTHVDRLGKRSHILI